MARAGQFTLTRRQLLRLAGLTPSRDAVPADDPDPEAKDGMRWARAGLVRYTGADFGYDLARWIGHFQSGGGRYPAAYRFGVIEAPLRAAVENERRARLADETAREDAGLLAREAGGSPPPGDYWVVTRRDDTPGVDYAIGPLARTVFADVFGSAPLAEVLADAARALKQDAGFFCRPDLIESLVFVVRGVADGRAVRDGLARALGGRELAERFRQVSRTHLVATDGGRSVLGHWVWASAREAPLSALPPDQPLQLTGAARPVYPWLKLPDSGPGS